MFQHQSSAFSGENLQSNMFHVSFWHSHEGISKQKEQHVFCLLCSNFHRFSLLREQSCQGGRKVKPEKNLACFVSALEFGMLCNYEDYLIYEEASAVLSMKWLCSEAWAGLWPSWGCHRPAFISSSTCLALPLQHRDSEYKDSRAPNDARRGHGSFAMGNQSSLPALLDFPVIFCRNSKLGTDVSQITSLHSFRSVLLLPFQAMFPTL